MLSFLLAQVIPIPMTISQVIWRTQEVRPLPGKLDNIPVFNSNSPELVLGEGILLSTFPPTKKTYPQAHLNFPLQGRFDLFAHHIAKAASPEDLRTLYLGVIIHNPGQEIVTINVLQAASYLSQPDAPFRELPELVENNRDHIYAGPGSRVMSHILRGLRQDIFPPQIQIPPGESQMLFNLPIPVRELSPPINGRSTYMRLHADGAIYLASLAMFAKLDREGQERQPFGDPQGKPTLAEWEELLFHGDLSQPRDRPPTPPQSPGQLIYGRVAGVSRGSRWKTDLVDSPSAENLTIPSRGEAISYGISTVAGNTLGQAQIQSARMLVRYPDTAYAAHGNYGVQYSLVLPLHNPTRETQTVTIALETPIKQEQDPQRSGLGFLQPLPEQIFFRGTVRLRYNDHRDLPRTSYFHLVQKRGQEGEPLVTLTMPPGDYRLVYFDLLYPPDATPPQVLTIKTLNRKLKSSLSNRSIYELRQNQ